MYRKGNNAILWAFVSFKRLYRRCYVWAKMAACEITLCFVAVLRFSHTPFFANILRSPKITCFCSQSQKPKDKNLYLAYFIALFSAVKTLLSWSHALMASKLMWRKKRNSSVGPHIKANYSWWTRSREMGIQGLLPLLKPIQKPVSIAEDFAGQVIGVDAYCWLHKGAYGCAMELVEGKKSSM